jgi:transposase
VIKHAVNLGLFFRNKHLFSLKCRANAFNVCRRTIERWIKDWAKDGVNSLPILPGRGVKTRLKGYEEEVAKQLEKHSINLKNVLLHFEKEHNIKICKKTLQNFLKGTGL